MLLPEDSIEAEQFAGELNDETLDRAAAGGGRGATSCMGRAAGYRQAHCRSNEPSA
jgi:hypothetical protein